MKKTQTIWQRVLSILWWVVVVLLAVVLIGVLGAKAKGEVPKVFGYSIMQIISGSMEPEIPTGSYILVKDCDPTEVKEGDVISFYSTDPMIYGLPNTHRVVEIKREEQGISFVTKGDANPVTDAVEAEGNRLIGVYAGPAKLLNALARMLDGNGMFIILIALQFGILTLVVLSLFKAKNPPNNPDTTPNPSSDAIEDISETKSKSKKGGLPIWMNRSKKD